ncbi:PhoX family protein [Sulfidibacter corallicola]|uniref:DUF839 domain-containing protein n=1 Tax=Sulfidibacter corallicola TaxID=2818388 RepID=A0A8A4TVJ3_SULCO|nr:alkaline phosphatase PhoX [Sulfidibacter corallicola]QTD53513.1 DUF839 domain-containing protein [Sulfidibacter corallicola]
MTSRTPIPEIVKKMVDDYAKGQLAEGVEFPLDNKITDTVRTIGFRHNVVAKWLDPLTTSDAVDAPRFGANCDFIAFFGDDWNADWESGAVNSSPMNAGSSRSGWVWVNHEYISNAYPTPESAPTGQHMTLARFLSKKGTLENDVTADVWDQADVDTYIEWHKKQVGGAWFRIVQDPLSLKWSVDPEAEGVARFDATSDTKVRVVGYNIQRIAQDDRGADLPENVVPGIAGDCSGGLSPWGTVVTAEENVQSYYGDLETAWSSSNRFKAGEGFDPGANVTLNVEPQSTDSQRFGRTSDVNKRRDRDNYGFLVEIDPTQDPSKFYNSANSGGDGLGHRKIGTMGRVRWENATFAVGADWKLIPNKPVVIYGANDRRSGRIYKFVSSQPYTPGMTRAQVRALLDDGDLYVAHFAGLDHQTGITLYDASNPTGGGIVPTVEAPGQGRWIKMSVTNTEDDAPNAPALGAGTKVGAALRDQNWNGIGGIPDENTLKAILFTACNKLGVAELNRPEDLEYNPKDPSGTPRVYVAFTNHTRPAANNQDGVMDENTPSRTDRDGSIFAMQEVSPFAPSDSKTFIYFRVWKGYTPASEEDAEPFAAGDPDNLAIGVNGEVFFGTDGNPGSTGRTRADAIYYLDLDPAHKEGAEGIVNPTYGQAFRFIASPGDSEATGPWFTPDQKTLFFNVQHPGSNYVESPSTWPQERTRPAILPRTIPVLKDGE